MSAPIALCDTKGMPEERWLECRMHGPKGDIPYTIGGSDVAAIFGVSPWMTPLELWKVKKRLLLGLVKIMLEKLIKIGDSFVFIKCLGISRHFFRASGIFPVN